MAIIARTADAFKITVILLTGVQFLTIALPKLTARISVKNFVAFI